MSRQTSVLTNLALGLPGDTRGAYEGQTRMAAVAINGGLFCVQGSRDETCKLPTASTDITNVGLVLGVSHSSVSRDPNFPSGGTANTTYQIGDSVELVYRGQVLVTVEEAVVPGDDVYVRYDTGSGGSQKGAFRTSADTSTAALLAGARYLTTAAIGGLALVDLNLPQ